MRYEDYSVQGPANTRVRAECRQCGNATGCAHTYALSNAGHPHPDENFALAGYLQWLAHCDDVMGRQHSNHRSSSSNETTREAKIDGELGQGFVLRAAGEFDA